MLTCGTLTGQTLVGTSPQNRTVLLEEYAAINCGNCPAAYAVAESIQNAHPQHVVGVGIHGGVLAVPSGGQPDFRTTEGTALWSQFGVNFQPQGMVNRQGLQAHGQWAGAVNSTLALPSPVNIGMETMFDGTSRLLTVNVELYYTSDGTGGNDRISVLLTQDHIIGYQQDYVNGPHAAFDHRHVLRGYITPLIGDEVATTTAGSTVLRTYTFTVPEAWNIDECHAVAFIGEQSIGSVPGVIYQVRSIAASGGSTVGITGSAEDGTGRAFPVPAYDLVTITLPHDLSDPILRLCDSAGRTLRELRVVSGQMSVVLDVSDLANGTYYYGVSAGPMRPLVVMH